MFGDFKNSKNSEIEEKILKYWQENRVFEKSIQKPAGKKPKKDFVFFDGPPFATGTPHYGHILASVIKDAIPRYKTMKGFRVERKWGWDCHGLPIENIVEQKLGLKTKKDIEKYGVENFNAEARREVLKYVDDWKRVVPRIGRWADMENDYRTMDAEYTESVWWVFKTLFEKKLVYEGYKSMHICPRCETTLSNFEVAQGYKNIEDSSIVAKFELIGEPNTYILAWTTTPWTLPGNVALAVNPRIDYLKIRLTPLPLAKNKAKPENLIIAESRASMIRNKYELVQKFKGAKLVGKKYKPLFNYYAKDKKLENRANGWKIYPADFVKTDEGTGIVHIAPAFGADDMALGQRHKLPFIQHVGMDGKFQKEVRDFAGLPVKPKGDHRSTDKKIIGLLDKQNKLFSSEEIIHSYPHCWRCDTPLLNYAASSWFVNVTAIKNKKNGLIDNNKKINWVPKHIKEGRFGKILEEAPDWAISRSRYWGAPLPVWQCAKCNSRKIIGSINELKENSRKSGNRYFAVRHGESLSNIKNISSASVETGKKHPLTLRGKEGALEAAAKLKSKKIDLIFSSDILRAKETAQIIRKELGLPKEKLVLDKRLREVNTGIFDGKNIEGYQKFATLQGKFIQAPPKGENLLELKSRVMDFLYEIDAKYKNKNILIVSHEYPIWLMLAGSAGANAVKSIEIKGKKVDFIKTGQALQINFSSLPHNHNYELDLHRPYIDGVELPCYCGGKMKRVRYVFDCWFESGSMPYGQAHYPFENKEKFDKNFPAEFIAEGVDQTRGWFYTLLVLSTGLFKKPAYKNVAVNGIILAEDGQKMSKRLKNYPDPMDVVQKYGADALRYYLLSSPVVRAEDLNLSERGVDEVYKKIILRLANVFAFYDLYAGRRGQRAEQHRENQRKPVLGSPQSANALDKWILVKLAILNKEVETAMDSYELDRATRPIAEFIDDLSTWYIRRSREKLRGVEKNKKIAVQTTRFLLNEFSKIIAPFMPFIADWLYFKLENQNSVHLEQWPKSRKILTAENDLIEKMKEVRKIASLGLEAREKAGIKVRQPLKELRIKNQTSKIKKNKELLEIIADEVNVKEISFNQSIGDEVELDVHITPELKEEGIFREFVRLIQGLRQKANYTPKDKIYLWMELPKELEIALSKQLKNFKARVGAESVEFRRAAKFDAEIESKIDSNSVWAGIKKSR